MMCCLCPVQPGVVNSSGRCYVSRVSIALPETFQFTTELPVLISQVNSGNHLGNDALISLMNETRVRFTRRQGFLENDVARGLTMVNADLAVLYQSEAHYGEVLVVSIAAVNFHRCGYDFVYSAITCVKPSGTVSQLTDSASGIHARHNPFYIRTVRGDNKDPLTQFMKEEGIPFEPDITKPDSVTVFSFPMKSPSGAITRTEMSAIEQLELWKIYALNWCEHKPSVTISVKEEEWMKVGTWLYDNFDIASGVSFLPFADHTYQQAPYQDIEAEEYLEWSGRVPSSLDWEKFSMYEKEDNTSGTRELACTADACEVVDLSSS